MTVNESLDIFGSVIPFQYYNGSDYVDSTFNYVNAVTMSSANQADSDLVGCTYLHYVGNVSGYTTDPNYISIDVRPAYSIFDTTQLYSCIALSNANSYYPASPPYSAPQWDWFWSGSNVTLQPSFIPNAMFDDYRYYSTYVRASFTSQSLTSGYSIRACFYGNTAKNNQFHLFIMCPYVDSESSGASGSFTTATSDGSSGGGDVNVTVDVDMEETNGLLGDIAELLGGIVDGIKNLFIPDDVALEEFSDDLSDLLEDHLGGIYEAADLIAGIWDQFENVSASSSIYIPPCNVPLAGSTLTLGDWTVPLKVDGLPQILYSGLAWIIDFIATASFLNMCRKKLEIFLNPDSEVVSNDH